MGRKLFQKHFETLTAAPPNNISHIRKSDEGEASFTLHYNKGSRTYSCQLTLLASDLEEYPDGNTYFLFTNDGNADVLITKSFDLITPLILGRPLSEAIAEVVQVISTVMLRGLAKNPIAVNDSDEDAEEEGSDDDFGDYEIEDDDNFGLNDVQPKSSAGAGLASRGHPKRSHPLKVDVQKIKSDLLAVKTAGFRVGVIGDLTIGGIVCVSVRVTKLGISEEAMQAWGLRRAQYFILLIRYLHGYRDAAEVSEDASLSYLTEMRVALCEHYKPTREDAAAAFDQKTSPVAPPANTNRAALEPLFIGAPLNELLRDRFAKILNFRQSCAFNWPSAEAFVHEVQGKTVSAVDDLSMDQCYLPNDIDNKVLPDIVKADEMDGRLLKDVSLPLSAMQFALRHLVRCTEFCLVCHCKVEDTFEALKPYVCSRPLCLYQYMALGFGPSIEWELLSQPCVVDLLISFCYAAAGLGRLKDFPVGIDLKVPRLPEYATTLNYHQRYYTASTNPSKTVDAPEYQPTFVAKLNTQSCQLLFEPSQKATVKTLRVGDWLLIRSNEKVGDLHYRVEEAMFPSYMLSSPIVSSSKEAGTATYVTDMSPLTPANTRPSTPPTTLLPGMSIVNCYCYSTAFDDLDDDEKQHSIIALLQTLPNVGDMRDYLQRQGNVQDPTLKTWRSRFPDSTLNLLRWIIASNRSCIMQVDQLSENGQSASMASARDGDRVAGMDQWIQFKFAQGAPDKEQRFIDSVSGETASQPHPTFFAWHGSPIGNWHSIIRQGLRFDETLHGRAYGNGVYMSNHLSTSLGYSGQGMVAGSTWPNSVLKISNAISLQEVVNAPAKFVSQSPHYVVADIDWVQTRYLFVRSQLAHRPSSTPIIEYAQDPHRLAMNESGQAVKVPITAVSKSRRPAIAQTATKKASKKSKTSTSIDQATAERQEDDANSIMSEDEDRAWFSSDNDGLSLEDDIFHEVSAGSVKHNFSSTSDRKHDRETDFEPGTLDMSNIQFLDPPKDATPSATKALMGWYKDAIKAQKTTPMHTLGWYMNPEHSDNMYQWIVELHSFNPRLPLAKDMKSAGITSIVLEMRFTNQFPFSPPFIRVVQPRFLPFNQGGGGHVTEGGAICMELLTNTGWSAVTSLEGVLLQVQLAMSEEERPARLLHQDSRTKGKIVGRSGQRGDCYGVGEAMAAYERACRTHGWQIPTEFSQFGGRAMM